MLRFLPFLLLLGACRTAAAPADLILVNGNVITVDSADRVAQAVAVRGDRIVAVGPTDEIERFAGPKTRRIDLAGRTVTPGLIDAHNHFAWGSTNRILLLDLGYPGVTSVADVQAKVATRAAATAPGAWIEGRGWDESKLAERRLLTAADLDRVSPNHPVWLTQTTGHYGVANSAALKLAGVTRETKDPPAGTIDRDPHGTPTGVLKESAQDLVASLIPAPAESVVVDGMKQLARAMNAEGMTGVKDPGIGSETWNAYRKALADSGLSVRVFVLWSGGQSMATAEKLIAERAAMSRPYESTGDDRLIAGGVKLYIDGSGGARTAWLYDDWNRNLTEVDRGNKGYPAANPDTIRALIKRYHDAGFHVSVHSIGDRAIDWTMDSYAAALAANPVRGRRHGIIHANIPTDRAIDMMAAMQAKFDAGYPEPSPAFTWWLGDTYAGNFGVVRSRRLNPFKTFARKGVRWAGTSDYNVTPFPARYGIWSAVTREPLLGVYGKDPFGTDEVIDVKAALRAFTIDAAYQMFLETKTGSIEVGKYADLAVWDRDFYTVPSAELKDLRCELTVFNGHVVYQAAAGLARLPMAVSNNAVAVGMVAGQPAVFSALGIDTSKQWSGITRRAFILEAGRPSWRELPPVPGMVGRLAATAQVVGGKLYLFGGYTVAADGAETSSPNVDIFDPATNQWGAGAPVPVPVDDAVSGLYRDSLVYLVSGWHDTDNVDAVQIYDPARNRWLPGTKFPGTAVFGHAGGLLGQSILVIDGARKTGTSRRYALVAQTWLGLIDPADPTEIAWRELPRHPGPALYRAAAAPCPAQGVILAAGGTDNPYNYTGLGYDGRPAEPRAAAVAFDPISATWRTLPPLAEPTMDHRGLAIVGDQAWTIGGMRAGQRVSARVAGSPIGGC